jgi:hypothetical protein
VAVVDATVDRVVGDDALDDELGAALRGQSPSPPSMGEGCVASRRRLQLLDLVRPDEPIVPSLHNHTGSASYGSGRTGGGEEQGGGVGGRPAGRRGGEEVLQLLELVRPVQPAVPPRASMPDLQRSGLGALTRAELPT